MKAVYWAVCVPRRALIAELTSVERTLMPLTLGTEGSAPTWSLKRAANSRLGIRVTRGRLNVRGVRWVGLDVW